MTGPKQDWTWVGSERVDAIHRLARWSQPATSLVAVLVAVASFAPVSDLGLGGSDSLVSTFALMSAVCLVFAAVTARALRQIAEAGSLDAWRSRRFVGFLIFLSATSWLFGVVLAGATSLSRATSLVPLGLGVVGSILLSVVTVRTAQLARPAPTPRS